MKEKLQTLTVAFVAAFAAMMLVFPHETSAKLTNWLYGDGATITGATTIGGTLAVTGATTVTNVLKGSTLAVSGLNTPLTADTCTAGQIAGGASYLYFCAATNDWKRVAWTDY